MYPNADWRLLHYDNRYNNALFEWKTFVSTKYNDHEHCEFCNKTITDIRCDDEDTDTAGYCMYNQKTHQTNWICKKCFDDFHIILNLRS